MTRTSSRLASSRAVANQCSRGTMITNRRAKFLGEKAVSWTVCEESVEMSFVFRHFLELARNLKSLVQ